MSDGGQGLSMKRGRVQASVVDERKAIGGGRIGRLKSHQEKGGVGTSDP